MKIDRTAVALGALGLAAVLAVAFTFAGQGSSSWLDGLALGGTGPAKRLAADQLRDPSSAKFRKVFVHQRSVCGEINGKNGFGAYSGFTRFYVAQGAVTMEPSGDEQRLPGLPTESETFDLGWRINCGDRA